LFVCYSGPVYINSAAPGPELLPCASHPQYGLLSLDALLGALERKYSGPAVIVLNVYPPRGAGVADIRSALQTYAKAFDDRAASRPGTLDAYVITACAEGPPRPGATADDPIALIASAFKGEAGTTSAGQGLCEQLTVDSLFQHLQAHLASDAVTLWKSPDAPKDCCIADIELSGLHDQPVPIEQRWALIRQQTATDIMFLGPTYLLDNSYRFIDWNPIFERLIAVPLSLRRGYHVEVFLERLANLDEIRRRSLTRFTRTSVPFTDIEPLALNTNEYGNVLFRKIAAQVIDEYGRRLCWRVNLNIDNVERNARKFWPEMTELLHREGIWTQYAQYYDEVIGAFSGYKSLRAQVCDLAGAGPRFLDLGCGTGNCTMYLLEKHPEALVHSIESNEAMLRKLDAKLDHHRHRCTLIKGDGAISLAELAPGSFDACVMMNVLFGLDDPAACLKEVHRVLRPGGVLALSTSTETTDVTRLFDAIAKEHAAKGRTHLDGKIDAAKRRNLDMVPIILRYTEERVDRFLQEAGFDRAQWIPGQYVGCVVVVQAVKAQPRRPVVKTRTRQTSASRS
jgi:ubiquinone/menaquinone biosynthesis C-methylase UbiE